MTKLPKIEDYLMRTIYFLTAVAAVIGTIYYLVNNNIRFLPLYYTILGHIALGIIVYSYNRRSRINIAYSFLVFFTGAMIVSSAVFFESQQLFIALLGAKFIYISTFLLMISLVYFSIYFPFEKPKLSSLQRFLIPVPGILLSALTLFSDLMVKDSIIRPWGREAVFGPIFPLFAIYCTICVGYAFAILIQKHGLSSGLQKTQIRYIFISFLIVGIPNFTANIILPAFFNDHRFIEAALYFALPEAALAAYAVLKHRLMSVEIIIQKGFVYAAVTALIMAFYALAVIISETFFRQVLGYSSLFITAGAALIIAIIYQPLVLSFQVLTDRLFFRERYDYQKTLRKISHEIASVIKLEELTRLIASSFIDTMKVSEISFLLPEKEKEHFRSVPLSISRYKKIEIDVASPIVSWLSASKDILIRDEIEDEIARQEALGREGKEQLSSLKKVRDEMEMLGISVWVPIVSKEELIGIIALGNKLSGDIFTTEDIGLLSTLANQTSVALDNARLYDEVVNMKDYNEEILQSMVNGVLTVDIKGRIITFNNMAEKITGRSSSLVLGKTSREIWGDKGTIPSIIDDTLRKEKHYTNFESGIISPEKGLTPVSFSSTILYDHAGKKIGALLIISDLTEVKELEGKVRRADKLSALATMAAGMAHEIKNPLSSIKVLSQLIPLKFQDEEFRKKVVEIMPREIGRIDRIIESLLGFARATAPKYEKMRIEDVIEEDVKYYTDQANSAGVKIIKNYAPIPQIMCDHDQITQVFSNLILNAIQAMPDGGELRIKTYEGKKIENILQNIVIEVSDTGHGISPQNLKKLFDPFFTTKYAGTGLGLTITHSIIDGHRGTIDVRSEPGRGTTFAITLPVSQELI